MIREILDKIPSEGAVITTASNEDAKRLRHSLYSFLKRRGKVPFRFKIVDAKVVIKAKSLYAVSYVEDKK